MQSSGRWFLTQLARCAFVFLWVGCRVATTPDNPAFDSIAPGTAPLPSDDDDSAPNHASTGAGGSKSSAQPDPDAANGNASATGANTNGASGAGTEPSGSDIANVGGTAGSSASDADGGDTASGASGSAASPSGAGAASGADDSPSDAICDAQSVSFDEIRRGEVRSNVKVGIDATATSQKFLLSHARSGSCLFAAFVGVAADASGPRGVLLVSYGADAPAEDACATGTDAIPDDLAPGDVVRAAGYLDAYAPSGCDAAPSPQLKLDAACPVQRSGRRAQPEPFALSLESAAAVARGTDAALVRRFAGGLVTLSDVHAGRPADGTGSVGPYGVIQLVETALEIHNDLEYGDLSLAGPGDPQKSLVFAYPTAFASVTGLVYLDYCTWSLAPRSRCADFAPPSANCD